MKPSIPVMNSNDVKDADVIEDDAKYKPIAASNGDEDKVTPADSDKNITDEEQETPSASSGDEEKYAPSPGSKVGDKPCPSSAAVGGDAKALEHAKSNGDSQSEHETTAPDQLVDVHIKDDDSKCITFDVCRLCARPFPGCISLYSKEG
jgi:hypothetical protein